VQLIAHSFLESMSTQEQRRKHFTAGALARLLDHRWPGNVRELRNAVQRAWVMAIDEEIDEEWLPEPRESKLAAPLAELATRVQALTAPTMASSSEGVLCIPLGTRLAEVERQVILATFAHCDQHKERTAATLGISMKTLYNRLKEYGS
jgi:two-component system response regulator AtoC